MKTDPFDSRDIGTENPREFSYNILRTQQIDSLRVMMDNNLIYRSAGPTPLCRTRFVIKEGSRNKETMKSFRYQSVKPLAYSI